MNEHLKPVFEVVLPKLEEANIDYWVYGGISIAAYTGNFVRSDKNKDVDMFVGEGDFEKAKSILSDLCKRNNFKLDSSSQKVGERPKVEVRVNGYEVLSMIPVYQKASVVVFKYSDGDQEYPSQILEKIERNISGYRFFTPQDEFIKKMFINHIKVRPGKKQRKEYKEDAKAILNTGELNALDWIIE